MVSRGTPTVIGSNAAAPGALAYRMDHGDARAIVAFNSAPRASLMDGVDTDGAAWCWGFNASGQLGDGTQTNSGTPVQVMTLGGALQIVAGYRHACARLDDGRARCWGSNDVGQVGDGTGTTQPLPQPVLGVADVVELAAGSDHTCARLRDDSIWCWGSNNAGQLGDGTRTERRSPVRVL